MIQIVCSNILLFLLFYFFIIIRLCLTIYNITFWEIIHIINYSLMLEMYLTSETL